MNFLITLFVEDMASYVVKRTSYLVLSWTATGVYYGVAYSASYVAKKSWSLVRSASSNKTHPSTIDYIDYECIVNDEPFVVIVTDSSSFGDMRKLLLKNKVM